MSVIAACITDELITIAADSILVKEDLKRKNFSKVAMYDNIIVGGCGSVEELSLFLLYSKRHLPKTASEHGILDYLCSFAEYKYKYTKNDTVENSYIIAYKNKLFETDGMFVQQVTKYTAIGEGESYALAALYLAHTPEEAVKCACEFCCNTTEPIHSCCMLITINENIE